MTTRDSRAASRMPSSRSNSQARVCFARSRRCSRLASRAMTLCRCDSCWSSRWRRRPSSSTSHSLSASMTSSAVGAEGAVDGVLVGPAARQHAGAARPAGIVVAGAGHHLAVGVGLAVFLGVALGAVAGRAVHRRLRAGGWRSRRFALVFALGLLALVLIVVARRLVEARRGRGRDPGSAGASRVRRLPGPGWRGRARRCRGRSCLRATAARDRRPCAPRAAAARGSRPRGSTAAPPRPSCSRCAQRRARSPGGDTARRASRSDWRRPRPCGGRPGPRTAPAPAPRKPSAPARCRAARFECTAAS